MPEFEVNYLMRLLSSVYVYLWVPLRLNYLRLKIKMRPTLNICSEVFAITALVLTGVPLSIVYMFAKGTEGLIKLWITMLCKIIETSTGIDKEYLSKTVLSTGSLEDEYSSEIVEETVNESMEEHTVIEEPETTEE